jgi:hypothetical protein
MSATPHIDGPILSLIDEARGGERKRGVEVHRAHVLPGKQEPPIRSIV